MEEKLTQYGLEVSAMHDSRYYKPELVISRKLTPYNCPAWVRKTLIEKHGADDWAGIFWGADYDTLFPEVKNLLSQRKAWHPKKISEFNESEWEFNNEDFSYFGKEKYRERKIEGAAFRILCEKRRDYDKSFKLIKGFVNYTDGSSDWEIEDFLSKQIGV